MMGVNRYYRDVAKEIEVDPTTTFGATGDHAIVLVGKMQKPVLKALDYAIAARHESLEAVHVSIDDEETKKLKKDWVRMNIQVPLRIIQSPYRDLSYPLIQSREGPPGRARLRGRRPSTCRSTSSGTGGRSLLHNHKARRIRQKLMLVHGVTIALVPWLLDSSDLHLRPPIAPAARPGPPRRAGAPGAPRADAAGDDHDHDRRPAARSARRLAAGRLAPTQAQVVAGRMTRDLAGRLRRRPRRHGSAAVDRRRPAALRRRSSRGRRSSSTCWAPSCSACWSARSGSGPVCPHWVRAGLGAGVLGSFTTFSAVMVSVVGMSAADAVGPASVYLVASLVLGLAAALRRPPRRIDAGAPHDAR